MLFGGDDSPRTSLRSFCPSLRLRRIEGLKKKNGVYPLCGVSRRERVGQRSVAGVSRRQRSNDTKVGQKMKEEARIIHNNKIH